MRFLSFFCLCAICLLWGCASKVKQPVIYPNDHYNDVGQDVAQQVAAECWQSARDFGLEERDHGRVSRSAFRGAVIGGATAGAYGVVRGDAGERAAAGAAGGAAGGAARAATSPNDPPPLFRRFVGRCLADQGFEVIGWQ